LGRRQAAQARRRRRRPKGVGRERRWPARQRTCQSDPAALKGLIAPFAVNLTATLHHTTYRRPPAMPLAALPSLPAVIAKLSHRPAIPFSLNLLYVLLAPFCPAPSAADPPPATWDAVETYYEPGTKAFWFTADDDEAAWAVILTHEIAPGLIKVHSALSDPSPDSTSREGLFQQIMSHLKETHAGKTTSFGGVPDGLQSTFDEFVEEPKGKPSRSFKVQKTLEVALRPGKVLDTTRFVADNLTRDEIPYVRVIGHLGLLMVQALARTIADLLPVDCAGARHVQVVLQARSLRQDGPLYLVHPRPVDARAQSRLVVSRLRGPYVIACCEPSCFRSLGVVA
jgi:hypothetical protein